ncbi:MAG TPA: BLUF domain-containing protein, partial [Hymenobacter sp.]
TEAQLCELLEQSRRHNAAAGITGLLLYSDGRYVQVLEGPRDKVRALYARIRKDPRHSHLVTICEGPGPTRWFTQWSMGLGYVAKPAAARALDTMLAQDVDPNTEVDYSLLRALLQAFGVTP